MSQSPTDLSQFSLHDLFRLEAESQVAILTEGLLILERQPTDATQLETLMRAAHSLKGAARIVNLDDAVRVAHVMEDCFVAAQGGKLTLGRRETDCLLQGVDLLARLSHAPESDALTHDASLLPTEIEGFVHALERIVNGAPSALIDTPLPAPVEATQPRQETMAPPAPAPPEPAPVARTAARVEAPPPVATPVAVAPTSVKEGPERTLRVTAESLNRLLGLSGEAMVEAHWLSPFATELLQLRRRQAGLADALSDLRSSLAGMPLKETQRQRLDEAHAEALACGGALTESHEKLEDFVRRSTNLTRRLYHEAQLSRMRPFSDRAQGFPRVVRDLAASLGKEARLELLGATTQVDRDILEKLEAPLVHLLRNALDHGLETPADRLASGKPAEGTLTLEARHSAGMLTVTLSDDGRGIDAEALRLMVTRKGLTTTETAARMSEEELIEFLFLPGFSTRDKVTELSGRGVGLDVVRSMVREVRGTVRLTSQVGRGTRCTLLLPLTLSVMRALRVLVGGEQYALPLARIVRTLRLPRREVQTLEGRQHFQLDGQLVGLVAADQLLELEPPKNQDETLDVVVIGEGTARHGLAVERLLGEGELVVQTLDPRLGKIRNISAGAILADRAPVLIIDVDDLLRSVETLASGGQLGRVAIGSDADTDPAGRKRRVLVVDDSLTVRELERKLLASRGYEVTVAVDGMDGWNTLRTGEFDLVISDVDMPRLDGIEMLGLIRKDPRLRALPVMVVSYKDREEDRRRGLEAGADYYLTKSSFHDESLLQAVADLIGGPDET